MRRTRFFGTMIGGFIGSKMRGIEQTSHYCLNDARYAISIEHAYWTAIEAR